MAVKNSTLLVEKDHADSPLFRTTNVAPGSENNYLTIVNDPGSKLNRTAYRTATTKISEDGKEVEVMAKTGEPVGSIQIAKRSFQDKYWNTAVQDYQTGSAEANFKYLVKDNSGAKLKVFALPAGIVTADASTGKLGDYFSRHAGIIAENGPAYDLLGIKGFATPVTPLSPQVNKPTKCGVPGELVIPQVEKDAGYRYSEPKYLDKDGNQVAKEDAAEVEISAEITDAGLYEFAKKTVDGKEITVTHQWKLSLEVIPCPPQPDNPEQPETPGKPGEPAKPGKPRQPGQSGKPTPQGGGQQMPPTGSYELFSLLLSGALVLAGVGVSYSRKRVSQR